jgi:ubiquinol-cytochrome c reductase cytochrome c subunit
VRRALAVVLGVLAAAGAAHAAAGGSVDRGRHLYGAYCAACHGPGAGPVIGAGPGRAQVQQDGSPAPAPSLAGVGALSADFYLRTGYMPLERIGEQPRRHRPRFDEQQIRDLVAYVASLAPGPPIPKPHPERGRLSVGFKLFADHCAGCHQIVARGGYITDGIPPALTDSTPTQVAEAVRIGPYVMPRFSETAITPAQLDSIIAYVEWAKHPDDRGGLGIGNVGPIPEGLVTWLVAAAVLTAACVVIGSRLKA